MRGTPRECLRRKLVDRGQWTAEQFDALSDDAVDAMAVGLGHAWVIERVYDASKNPDYWTGAAAGPDFQDFEDGYSNAIRFSRQKDAEAVLVGALDLAGNTPVLFQVAGYMFDEED